MSDFINNIMTRHLQPSGLIKPRVRGLYESVENIPLNMNSVVNNGLDAPSDHIGRDINNIGRDINNSIETISSFQNNLSQPILKQNTVMDNLKINNDKIEEKSNRPPVVMPLMYQEIRDKVEPASAIEPLMVYKNNQIEQTKTERDSMKSSIETTGEVIKPSFKEYHIETSTEQTLNNNFSWLQNIKKAADQLMPPPQLPIIKVSIGRIEVKALQTSQPPPIRNQTVVTPQMSLQEYLKKTK